MKNTESAAKKITFPMRINKYLAYKGLTTRKGADELIAKGKVLLNGKVAALGAMVLEKDAISVTEKKKSYHYYAYNKPKGVVTSTPLPGEKEILDIAKFPFKVFTVGRLDKDSRGLIIFTDDGRITDRLLNPAYDHEKEYLVTTDKTITPEFITKMSKGVRIETGMTKPADVKKESSKVFRIILGEGKKRQIRRMCDMVGYKVTDLLRIRVMNILLGKLPEKSFRAISGKELEEFLLALKLEK